MHISYRAHVARNDWQETVETGVIAGTVGEKKAIEAIRISLNDAPPGYAVEYRAYMKDLAWGSWVEDGEMAGTVGQYRRLEAIQVRIRGRRTPNLGVVYQAQVADLGWMPFVWNGQVAGTLGEYRRLEAIKIILARSSEESKVADLVSLMYKKVDLPLSSKIPSGYQVDRQDLKFPSDLRCHVDVGGEGPVESGELVTGFKDAFNLQAPSQFGEGRYQTQNPKARNIIPNLVRMQSWQQTFPFKDGFADLITMQNAPLESHGVDEIARILNKKGGRVSLWIDQYRWYDNIQKLAKKVNGEVTLDPYDEFQGRAGQSKITIIAGGETYSHDEL